MTQPPNLRFVTEDTHTWDDLAGKPATYPAATHRHVWGEIDAKPATYPPATHSHTKADVGLGNVDNTSDAAKPVSTAMQTALDGKAATSHTHTPASIGAEPVAWQGTQTAYDALGTKDPARSYFIV